MSVDRPHSNTHFLQSMNKQFYHYLYLPQEMCSKFWPLKMSEPKTFGSIKVCLDDKVEQASYNEYHLTVSFTVRTCCIYRAWA